MSPRTHCPSRVLSHKAEPHGFVAPLLCRSCARCRTAATLCRWARTA
jgi:hypothetical protein